MFYDFPIKRRFTTPISTELGGCILKYEQNVMRDTMLMMQNYEIDGFLEGRLKEFLEESLQTDGNKDMFLKLLLAHPNSVFNRIRSNINKSHDTIYSKITIRDEDSSGQRILLSTTTMLICEKYGISGPMELFDNYTLEQYEWMLEGLRYYNYAQDKKLSVYNTRAMNKKYNEQDKNKELMEYMRKGPTKEFLDKYYKKNG